MNKQKEYIKEEFVIRVLKAENIVLKEPNIIIGMSFNKFCKEVYEKVNGFDDYLNAK